VSDRVRVWCLRHAEASHTTAGIAGAVPTAPLTTRGHHQALAAAQQLAGEPLARIYSSTALRARQTAGLLAAGSTVDVVALPELDEVGVGAHVLRAWIVEQQLGRRGAGGETGQQVVARVAAAFREIARAHPGETVAVVGHVASLTVALGRLCALGARVWGTPLPHARPFLVQWDGRAWRCPAWPGALE
jgi:broad specificity phosphatase PhoE